MCLTVMKLLLVSKDSYRNWGSSAHISIYSTKERSVLDIVREYSVRISSIRKYLIVL